MHQHQHQGQNLGVADFADICPSASKPACCFGWRLQKQGFAFCLSPRLFDYRHQTDVFSKRKTPNVCCDQSCFPCCRIWDPFPARNQGDA